MPRKARVVVVGTPHHVYLRGNNRRRLFSDDDDRWFWLRCLELALLATGCALHQLTLMTNHIHMLLTPNAPKALAQFMKRACQRYAQQRNVRMNASGKLFEERYHSKVITDEEQLMMTTLYNDANAFRARLVTSPTDHVWSTGPLHAARGHSNVPRSMWTPTSWYERLGATSAQRGRIYRQLIAAYAKHDIPEGIEGETSDEGSYRQRIARPDGTSAREPLTQWGLKRR